MASLSGFMSCNVGGTGFQIEDYEFRAEAVIKAGFGRIGTKVTIAGKGWIEGDNLANLYSAVQEASLSFSVSGQLIVIAGIGGRIEQVLTPAGCVDGGPHISFQVGTGNSSLTRPVAFTATGTTAPDGPIDTYSQTIAEKIDGLHVITRRGTIYGPNGGDFFDQAWADFQGVYALPSYETHQESTVTNDQYLTTVSYMMEATQTADVLPSAGAVQSVAGSASRRVERDEQFRMVTTYDFDLQLLGSASEADAQALMDKLRADAVKREVAKQPFSEASRITSIDQVRLSCTFEFVDGGNGNALANWQQTLEGTQEISLNEGIQYVGAAPILVSPKLPLFRVTQRGTATGIGVFVKAPDPLFPSNQETSPRSTYQVMNDREYVTNWEYNFIFLTDIGINSTKMPLSQLARPATPDFFDPTAPPVAVAGGAAGGAP